MAVLGASPQKQHFVAVPLPAQGHLNPLMRFCQLLAAHDEDCVITFVNVDPIQRRIAGWMKNAGKPNDEEEEDGGEETEAVGRKKERRNGKQDGEEEKAEAEGTNEEEDRLEGEEEAEAGGRRKKEKTSNIRQVSIPIDGLDLAEDFRVSFQPFFDAQNSILPRLEALLLRLNRHGPPVTCLISDIGITLPTQKVADKFNIPRIVLYPCSASLQLLISYAIQGQRTSAKQVLEGLWKEKTDVFCDVLPGLPSLLNRDLPDWKHIVDDNAFMWELIAQTWQQSESRAHAMVINSFDELEGPIFRALAEGFRLPVYGIGPLSEPLQMETSLWKKDEACIAWLDKQPPLSVLYISFGSITVLSQSQCEELMAGLQSSQQRFLWVCRLDLIEGTMASRSALECLMPRCSARGCVVGWAPQLEVLSHPSVGGFLTHCGWNSIIEAIAHGVPMLCWPYFADQFLYAKYIVEEWKIGLHLKRKETLLERNEVQRIIKELMQGVEGKLLRENVVRLKEAGCHSLLPGGRSHKNMEILLKSLHSPHQASK